MEGKVSKDTWNIIRQIYVTGRSSRKALKVLPILPSGEALSSGDQPANLLGGEREQQIIQPWSYLEEICHPTPVWPAQ